MLLSGRKRDDVISGTRVEIEEDKKSPEDFALWKFSKENEPYWASPWGKGRPGWHIECSSMIEAILGKTIDIHCGGNDLIFPHHENEIAQSKGAYPNEVFVKYWLHNGMLNLSGKKITILVAGYTDNLFLAVRNIPNIYLVEATSASTYDLLDCESILFDKAGLSLINKQLTLN